MATVVHRPCFEQLTTYQTRHIHKREATFEKDLVTLTNQLIKKLDQRTKMLKNMKKIAKKRGKSEIQLTKWKFDMFSPVYPHSSKTQRWMYFRAVLNVWKIVENIYGSGFIFKIKDNPNNNSKIRYHLFLCWNQNNREDMLTQFSKFERPSHLEFDPRQEIYKNIEINHLKNVGLKAKERYVEERSYHTAPSKPKTSQSHQYAFVPSSPAASPRSVTSPEPSELGAPTYDSFSSGSSLSSYLDKSSPVHSVYPEQ